MKDNATNFVKISYHSKCLTTAGATKQTNKCDNIKVLLLKISEICNKKYIILVLTGW